MAPCGAVRDHPAGACPGPQKWAIGAKYTPQDPCRKALLRSALALWEGPPLVYHMPPHGTTEPRCTAHHKDSAFVCVVFCRAPLPGWCCWARTEKPRARPLQARAPWRPRDSATSSARMADQIII